MNDKRIESAFRSLLEYCSNQYWKGYDPYDGLNSRILEATPLSQSKLARLVLTQFCKRSPINLRSLLLVEKGHNPKALGLFLSSLLQQYSVCKAKECRASLDEIIQLLKRACSKGYSGYCWGYNFDWQSRTSFVPKSTPNAICTTFVANAFLDAHMVLRDQEFAEIARSACDVIVRDLNVISDKNGICFSYTPLDHQKVHNVNLLCAALLSRVYELTGETRLFDYAYKAVNLTVSYQNQDGSWYYGTQPFQRWIDNFHTGFNLVALHRYMKFSGQDRFHKSLQKGFEYYRSHFFVQDTKPKYYHNSLYPIDIHSVAQSIITLVELRDFAEGNILQAEKIAQWSIANMQDTEGFFYFQKHKSFTNKTSYMRWCNAWMLYALSSLLTLKVMQNEDLGISDFDRRKAEAN